MQLLYADHLRIQRERTDAAMQACGFESLAIYAGALHMQFLDDQPYPFKPNPHFRLWTPLEHPIECWVVYRPAKKLQLIFWQPLDYWHKPPAAPDGFWTENFEIATIREPNEAKAHVERLPHCAFIGEWREEFAAWGFAERNPSTLLARLHYPRAIKTAYEIECIRRASQRAARGHRAAESAFRNGASEYEIHMAYLQASGHVDEELPYPSIVALNGNAAVLHYQHLERNAPTQRFSFLIDAGAQHHGYGADITRTYSYADDEFAALIEGVHRLQQKLCSQVRSGTDYVSIHSSAHVLIGDLLHEAGLITMSGADALESGLSSVFLPHGVGHLLGLQVHDVGGHQADPDGARRPPPDQHPALRLTRTLEPGFVVTIEPGLYFIDLLLERARNSKLGQHIRWEHVGRLKPCGGIRIEDDVVCTEGEPENLTRDAFG